MRYLVRGLEIRSENAAKPTSTPSQWLLDCIADFSPNWRVLDLGCGKLRYTVPLARHVKAVVAVDSREQIDRNQTVNGEADTSVREFVASRFDNVRVFALHEKGWRRWRYDRILIAFVLSAIPVPAVRLDVLRTARDLLKLRDGKVLVAATFANSRFKDWERSARAEPYRDGYLIHGPSRTSFYGLIKQDKLRRYCREVGLAITHAGTVHGQTAYVVAGWPKE